MTTPVDKTHDADNISESILANAFFGHNGPVTSV